MVLYHHIQLSIIQIIRLCIVLYHRWCRRVCLVALVLHFIAPLFASFFSGTGVVLRLLLSWLCHSRSGLNIGFRFFFLGNMYHVRRLGFLLLAFAAWLWSFVTSAFWVVSLSDSTQVQMDWNIALLSTKIQNLRLDWTMSQKFRGASSW